MKKIILSKVDEILKMVRERRRVSLGEIARELKVPYALVEEWAHILEERDDVVLVYPPNPFAEPYLQLAKEKRHKKKKTEKKKEKKGEKKKKRGLLTTFSRKKKKKVEKRKEKKVVKKVEKSRKKKEKRKKSITIVEKESPIYHLYRRLFG